MNTEKMSSIKSDLDGLSSPNGSPLSRQHRNSSKGRAFHITCSKRILSRLQVNHYQQHINVVQRIPSHLEGEETLYRRCASRPLTKAKTLFPSREGLATLNESSNFASPSGNCIRSTKPRQDQKHSHDIRHHVKCGIHGRSDGFLGHTMDTAGHAGMLPPLLLRRTCLR